MASLLAQPPRRMTRKTVAQMGDTGNDSSRRRTVSATVSTAAVSKPPSRNTMFVPTIAAPTSSSMTFATITSKKKITVPPLPTLMESPSCVSMTTPARLAAPTLSRKPLNIISSSPLPSQDANQAESPVHISPHPTTTSSSSITTTIIAPQQNYQQLELITVERDTLRRRVETLEQTIASIETRRQAEVTNDKSRAEELNHKLEQETAHSVAMAGRLAQEHRNHRIDRVVHQAAMRWRVMHLNHRNQMLKTQIQELELANQTIKRENKDLALQVQDLTDECERAARQQTYALLKSRSAEEVSFHTNTDVASTRMALSREQNRASEYEKKYFDMMKELNDVKAELMSLRCAKSSMVTTVATTITTDTKKRPAPIPVNVLSLSAGTPSGMKKPLEVKITATTTLDESSSHKKPRILPVQDVENDEFGTFAIPVDDAPPSPMFAASSLFTTSNAKPRPSFIRHHPASMTSMAAPVSVIAGGVPRKSFFRPNNNRGMVALPMTTAPILETTLEE